MKRRVKRLSERLRARLEAEGIHTHVDDGTTTGSVYLDLDRGALASVRVSDHKGRGMGYRFEIGPHISHRHETTFPYLGGQYQIQKFPETCVEELIEAILILRLQTVASVGKSHYNEGVKEDEHRNQYQLHLEGSGREPRPRT